MKNVVIEMSGGVIQEVYCNDLDVRVFVIDWDELSASPTSQETTVPWPCEPLSCLPLESAEALDGGIDLSAAANPDYVVGAKV